MRVRTTSVGAAPASASAASNDREAAAGLQGDIAGARAVGEDGGGAGDEDPVADAHGAGEADRRLEGGAGGDAGADHGGSLAGGPGSGTPFPARAGLGARTREKNGISPGGGGEGRGTECGWRDRERWSRAVPGSWARTCASGCCATATRSSASTTCARARRPTSRTCPSGAGSGWSGPTSPSASRSPGDVDAGAALRLARLPGGLPAAAGRDAAGRVERDAARAGPGAGEGRALPARVDVGDLRRPAGAPAARELLGPRQPGRAPRGLRRGQAVRRGATMAYRRSHGVDTAIVRIFNTYGPRMRPDDGRAVPTFVRQALRRGAAHGGGRRHARPGRSVRRRPGRGMRRGCWARRSPAR